jgi:hypothetical protein
MLHETVKTKDDICFSLGEIFNAPPGATYTYGVEVRLPEGKVVRFAVLNIDSIDYRLAEGDFVIVKYTPADQFASIVSLWAVVKNMGYEVE